MGLHDGMLRSALHRLVLGKVSKCARNNLLLFLIAFPFRSYREELATELAASCQRQRHRGVLSDGRWEVGTRGIQGSFRTPPRDRAVGSTRCAPPLRWPVASAHALRILPRIRRCFHSFLFDFVCLCARNCYHSDSQICLIIVHTPRGRYEYIRRDIMSCHI